MKKYIVLKNYINRETGEKVTDFIYTTTDRNMAFAFGNYNRNANPDIYYTIKTID